jgi:hypothetical protein
MLGGGKLYKFRRSDCLRNLLDALAMFLIGLGAAALSGMIDHPLRKFAFLFALAVAGIAAATQNHMANQN